MSKKTTGCDHWKTLIITNNAKNWWNNSDIKMAAHIPHPWAHKNVWSYIYIFIYKFVFLMPEQSRFTVIFCTTVVHMLPYLTITRNSLQSLSDARDKTEDEDSFFLFFMHFWRETIKNLFHFSIPVNHWIESNNECTLEMIYKPHIHWSSNNDAKKNHHGPMRW